MDDFTTEDQELLASLCTLFRRTEQGKRQNLADRVNERLAAGGMAFRLVRSDEEFFGLPVSS